MKERLRNQKKVIFRMEFQKLCQMPVFYLLVLMFIGFNLWLFLDSKSYYIEAIQSDSKLLEESPEQFGEIYAYELDAKVDLLEIKEMAQRYEAYEKESEQIISANYGRLQQRADSMEAEEKDSLTFTGAYRLHSFLFSYYLKYMMIECLIIIVLAVIYSMHFEVLHNTEDLVLVSKTGPNVFKIKLRAAFLFAMLLSLIIMGVSLGVYFGIVNYAEIWGAYRCI